jgi:hypothetical protein
MKTINNISDEQYITILQNSLAWIKNQTTVHRVKNLLAEFISK